jgi:hypothetical protein
VDPRWNGDLTVVHANELIRWHPGDTFQGGVQADLTIIAPDRETPDPTLPHRRAPVLIMEIQPVGSQHG